MGLAVLQEEAAAKGMLDSGLESLFLLAATLVLDSEAKVFLDRHVYMRSYELLSTLALPRLVPNQEPISSKPCRK